MSYQAPPSQTSFGNQSNMYHQPVAGSMQSVKSSKDRKMFNGEVKLFENAKERRRVEELADLYSIVKATESLEVAYSRDALSSTEYAETCTKLISQFKSTESALVSSKAIPSGDGFFKEFKVDCPRAYHRLLEVGVPATVLHASHDDRAGMMLSKYYLIFAYI